MNPTEKPAGSNPPDDTVVSPSVSAASGPLSQVQIIADALDRGEHLTVLIALQKYGIYALSQRCGELAKWYPVESRSVKTPTGKWISEYFKGGISYG